MCNRQDNSADTTSTSKDQKVTNSGDDALAIGAYDSSQFHFVNEFPEEVVGFTENLFNHSENVLKQYAKTNENSLKTVSQRLEKQESDIENLASLTTPLFWGGAIVLSTLIFTVGKK